MTRIACGFVFCDDHKEEVPHKSEISAAPLRSTPFSLARLTLRTVDCNLEFFSW